MLSSIVSLILLYLMQMSKGSVFSEFAICVVLYFMQMSLLFVLSVFL